MQAKECNLRAADTERAAHEATKAERDTWEKRATDRRLDVINRLGEDMVELAAKYEVACSTIRAMEHERGEERAERRLSLQAERAARLAAEARVRELEAKLEALGGFPVED